MSLFSQSEQEYFSDFLNGLLDNGTYNELVFHEEPLFLDQSHMGNDNQDLSHIEKASLPGELVLPKYVTDHTLVHPSNNIFDNTFSVNYLHSPTTITNEKLIERKRSFENAELSNLQPVQSMKRVHHILTEKKRRHTIKSAFEELSSLLPHDFMPNVRSKPKLLFQVIKYVNWLLNRSIMLETSLILLQSNRKQ